MEFTFPECDLISLHALPFQGGKCHVQWSISEQQINLTYSCPYSPHKMSMDEPLHLIFPEIWQRRCADSGEVKNGLYHENGWEWHSQMRMSAGSSGVSGGGVRLCHADRSRCRSSFALVSPLDYRPPPTHPHWAKQYSWVNAWIVSGCVSLAVVVLTYDINISWQENVFIGLVHDLVT